MFLLSDNLTAAAPLAFINGIGGLELVLIMVVALLLFGGQGLPNVARTLGRTLRELKKATGGIEEEIKRAMHDDPAPKPRPKPPVPAITEPVSPPPPVEEPAKDPADVPPPKA